VLDPDGTALSPPLLQVLDTLFAAYDKDQDDALRNEELDHYVFSTNGQHPSQDFLEAMGQRFGANDRGWLTKAGFMVS
jgi:Ca2+-binding EF-hand superfamily protein